MTKKRVVIIGGGTATFTLLSGLRGLPLQISVIVSTADDGGSTGRLREELGIVPPGDIRQTLLGFSEAPRQIKDLFAYRFARGQLRGHTVGNIILAGLQQTTGSVEQAIVVAAKFLQVQGQVVPVTLFPTKLTAVLENGKKITGEHYIDEPQHDGNLRIRSLRLRPNAPVNPAVLRQMRSAHAIILGPGDLYTSTLPNLLVRGVAAAIRKSRAKKIVITNLMTKFGQTNQFRASDFVRVLRKYLGRNAIDAAIVNTQKPNQSWLLRHRRQKSEFVLPDLEKFQGLGVRVVAAPLLAAKTFAKSPGDELVRSHLRHDARKLARIIQKSVE